MFTESHCVGHQCWHLHDPTYPAFDAAIAAQTGDPILEVYRAIDGAIGEILRIGGRARRDAPAYPPHRSGEEPMFS